MANQAEFLTLDVSASHIADSPGLLLDHEIISPFSKQSNNTKKTRDSVESTGDDISFILAQWVAEETVIQKCKKSLEEHREFNHEYDPVRLLREAEPCMASRPPTRFLRR